MKRKPNPITAFPAQPFPRPAIHSCAAARSRPLAPTAQPLTTSHQPLTTTHSPRRGVLLLVVLSLLLLFSMVAVTFVLVAGRHYETTRYAIRNEQVGDDPRQLLDEVFAQCIRGTNNPQSVIGPHSLLEDMYGNDGIRGEIDGATPAGPLFTLSVTNLPTSLAYYYDGNNNRQPFVQPAQIATVGAYNGCVLTMTSGVAAGRSTRIVGWDSASATGPLTISILKFDDNLQPAQGDDFVINGRPFNGTGFGFNPLEDPNDPTNRPTLLSAAQTYNLPNETPPATFNVPLALLPNPVFNAGVRLTTLANPTVSVPFYTWPSIAGNPTFKNFGGPGGFDEDYDAADPQNMLLAYVPLNATAPGVAQHIVPSLHRPQTIDYLDQQLTPYVTDGVEVRRHVMRQTTLRPYTGDHRRFPQLPNVFGPYDVDNDGDGVAESVWVDAGLPVRTAPDGRTYKPMVAIHCVDLDSRLNVNAHGNIAQATNNYGSPITGAGTVAEYLFNSAGPATAQLPRGQGYGPAEINLTQLFSSPTEYEALFKGGTFSAVEHEGRYGEWGTATGTYSAPLPGVTGTYNGADDFLASLKRFGIPQNNFSGASGFGLPVDVWGRSVMGVDFAGLPVYSFLTKTGAFGARSSTTNRPHDEWPNDPYVVNLTRSRASQSAPTTNDNLFSVAELERLLRIYDVDSANLPDRLRAILYGTGGTTNFELSKLITTDSNDVPVPPGMLPRDIAVSIQAKTGSLPGSTSFLDIVRVRIADAQGINDPMDPQVTAALESLIDNRVIAPELVAGKKFNVNRPFGNGLDDDADGIVDEPGENEAVPAAWSTAFGASATYMDFNQSGVGEANESLLARQDYARQLYFLMLTLSDTSYLWASNNGTAFTAAELTQQREVTTRQIAQWAINVVDFRDPDSIMTGFEYDTDPFDGWDANGDLQPTTGERVVWGVEYPELLITETLAFHDRRVEDAAMDTGSNDRVNNPNDPTMPDDDFDQRRKPEGSLFLELYCPRSPLSDQFRNSRDLYSVNNELDLAQMAPGGAGGVAYPVWRVGITGPNTNTQNNVATRLSQATGQYDAGTFNPTPDPAAEATLLRTSLFDPNNAPGAVQIERLIWFAPVPTNHPDLTNYTVFSNAANSPALLKPGNYAVIGPRPETWVGTDNTGAAPPQTIFLDPNAVSVQFNSTAGPINPVQVLNIICSGTPNGGWPSPIGMNVSEPLFSNYYAAVPTGIGPTGETDTFPTPQDVPLDGSVASGNINPNSPIGNALGTNSLSNFRFALLQRLANPKLSYDPITNPYVTVDWQGIDLTVFNGQFYSNPGPDPDDATPNATPAFGSRERGNVADPQNVWNPIQFTPSAQVSKGVNPVVFDYNLNQTIGLINQSFGGVPYSGTHTEYAAQPDPATSQQPFPWFTWSNRPFISETELMLVPCGAAEQVLRHYVAPSTDPGTPNATNARNPFRLDVASYHLPFRQLFNFRLSTPGLAGTSPGYARVLDYLHVPSPYVGTETFIDPSGTTKSTGTPSLLPPYNFVSHFREPGRVNINTIAGRADTVTSPVWDAILQSVPGGPQVGPTWAEIVASRRGEAAAALNVTGVFNTADRKSSFFARPFRSAAGAAYALPGTLPGTYPAQDPLDEIDVTLLREWGTTGRGLFEDRMPTPPKYADSWRNAYFHHQPLLRLRNLLTTRSNVYAIWITVGYFEVRPAAQSGPGTPYPDGYELLAELGSDTGETKRHRAFYIYDRTIPVAFERGQDHNFKDGLLLQRFIE